MPAFDPTFDERLRSAAFGFLDGLAASGKAVVNRDDLAGFRFDGAPFRLIATQQGIWKPHQLAAALSFRTAYAADPAKRPYDDSEGPDGYLRYKWQGHDPRLAANRGLREAMVQGVPLIWFVGVERGVYLPRYPVYLAEEEPGQEQFVVSLDEDALRARRERGPDGSELLRSYARREVEVRLHQPLFRQRVLLAYGERCALCNLRHTRLLDAAHVVPDAEGGEPVVTNGISMCKIHHAAYDADIFGISPGYRVGVRKEVMAEIDGPTLRYTLQAIDGSTIALPARRSARPDPEHLDVRWRRFLAAS